MPDKVPVPVISLRLILILSWILCLGLVNSSYSHKWKFMPHTAAAAEIKVYAVVNKRSSLIMMLITRHAINLSACNICIQMQPHRITVTHLCATLPWVQIIRNWILSNATSECQVITNMPHAKCVWQDYRTDEDILSALENELSCKENSKWWK